MDNFIKISQLLGGNMLYVQGAGGNTSIKIRDKLYIKSSGYKLKNMTEKHGYACCLYRPLAEYVRNKKTYTNNDESHFLQLVNENLIQSETYGLPSMETGFHAIIPSKYVFHLHSVYANVFLCMKYGSYFIKKICENVPYIIIDYKNPGYELAYVLSKKETLPSLIFLKNHGIIIQGQDINDCVRLIEWLHATIEEYFKKENAFFPFGISLNYIKLQNYSFPDSAVFSNVNIQNLPINKQKEVLEIASAQWYITEMIKRLGQNPSYLSTKAINKLLNMQQEKHRVKIFQE